MKVLLFHDIGRAVSMSFRGIALGMGLEDVVHHGQTEAAHQFVVELQVTVVHTLKDPMEVAKQMTDLIVCKFDDWVLVQRDAAADAVVVRRQQVLKELIVSRKPFHLHIAVCREVAHAGGVGYHH